MLDPDQLLTVRQAAELLGLNHRSIYDLRGKIPFYKVGAKGGSTRLRRGDILDYIASCRDGTREEAEVVRPRVSPEALAMLQKYIFPRQEAARRRKQKRLQDGSAG